MAATAGAGFRSLDWSRSVVRHAPLYRVSALEPVSTTPKRVVLERVVLVSWFSKRAPISVAAATLEEGIGERCELRSPLAVRAPFASRVTPVAAHGDVHHGWQRQRSAAHDLGSSVTALWSAHAPAQASHGGRY